jgi:hypothetical protein
MSSSSAQPIGQIQLQVLRQLEQTQALHIADRDRLRAELAAVDRR